jgi:CHAD domain-containing protein
MPCTARTQLLMDPDELAELKRIARRRKTSVGKLIRDAVREVYLAPDLESRRRAVEAIAAMNIGPLPDWDVLKEELDARFDDLLPGHERLPLRRRRSPRAS